MTQQACSRRVPSSSGSLTAQLRRPLALRRRWPHKHLCLAAADRSAASTAAAAAAAALGVTVPWPPVQQGAGSPALEQQQHQQQLPWQQHQHQQEPSQLQQQQQQQYVPQAQPELQLTPPDPQHILVVPDFLASGDAFLLRQQYEERMVLDLLRPEERRARWDTWLMPDRYRLMRIPADRFFPPTSFSRLRQALAEYGGRVLGCPGVSQMWLSYYTERCRLNWQCAAPLGPFVFTLSLTRWEERGFSGGEAMLLGPSAFETDETTLIDPRFNQLVLFDSRLPHGVREVSGTDDPLDARVMLHGWLTEPQRSVAGSLSAEEAAPALDTCVEAVHAAIAALDCPPASGTVVVRLEIEGPSGRVVGLRWLVNTLVAPPPFTSKLGRSPPPWAVVDAVTGAIRDQCVAASFPRSRGGGGSTVTLPLHFT